MNLSKLLATSLTLLSVLAVGVSAAEARNPAKGVGGDGIVNGTTYVFATDCGTDAGTTASFQSTTGFPLQAVVNESSTLTSGYAGALIFTPVANLDLTNLATFTSPLPQGTFTQIVNVNPNTYTGTPVVDQVVAYSWVNKNGNTKYGISFIPTSFVAGSNAFTNQALKGKSFQTTLVADTLLTDLYNAGDLFNLIGNDPGKNATNFQLLGIGDALANLGSAGTSVNAGFNSFQLNNVYLTKAVSFPTINCSPLIPSNSSAAAAARAR